MRLILVRHGRAGRPEDWKKSGRPDEERPLTEDGRARCRGAFRGLRRLLPSLDLIAASPLLRARQTADELARVYRGARRLALPELAPGAEPADLARRLDAIGLRTCALVGHEPGLGRLGAWLLAGNAAGFLPLKKGACALIEFPGAPRAGRGALGWALPASALARLR